MPFPAHFQTRIVATSTYHWLPEADVIVVMSEGEVVEMGDYQQLVSEGGHLARLLATDSSRGMKTIGTAASCLSGYLSDDEDSQHREVECTVKVVHEWSQPQTSSSEDTCRQEMQGPPVSMAATKQPVLPRLETSVSPLPRDVNAWEEDACLSGLNMDDDPSTCRPQSPTRNGCSADNPADLPNQGLRASAESPVDSDDDVNSGLDVLEGTLTSTLTLNSGEDGCSMTTVVEHSEDDLLTDSAGRKSRERGLDETTTTQSGMWSLGNLLTSVSCEPLSRGRQLHAVIDDEQVHVGKVRNCPDFLPQTEIRYAVIYTVVHSNE